MADEWLDKYTAEYGRDPDYLAQRSSLAVIEEVLALMREHGVTRSELAERLGVSRAYVSRLFGAPTNLTLRSMAQLAVALDGRLSVHIASGAPAPASEELVQLRAAGVI